jgi:hypothetical protein
MSLISSIFHVSCNFTRALPPALAVPVVISVTTPLHSLTWKPV